MRKTLFSGAAVFLVAASVVQFQYDLASDEFKRTKKSEFRLANMFDNMPEGGYSANEVRENIDKNIQRLNAEIRGEKTVAVEDVQLERWIVAQKEKDRPLVLFLYGAALLFLFGGLMKSSKINCTTIIKI